MISRIRNIQVNKKNKISVHSEYNDIKPIEESQKIDIICYHDSYHECLYNTYFFPTYDICLKSHFNLYNNNEHNNDIGSFGSKKWSEILIKRFDILIQYININKDKWAIFSDVDIIFLDNIYNNIIYYINNTNNINIFYMPELIRSPSYDINGGFFLFKCCDQILELFKTIQSLSRQMVVPNDQTVIKDLLRKKKFTNGLLDPMIFLTNNNNHNIIKSNIKTMKVFHSTSAANIIEKNLVLSSVLIHKEISINKKYLLHKNLWNIR